MGSDQAMDGLPSIPAMDGLPGDALVLPSIPAMDGLPGDALVLLIGPSGCGKSTWAAHRFGPDQVLSSDGFRAMLAGDAGDQSATAEAFRVLHLVLKARLRRGLLTVVDATNLTVAARRSLLRASAATGRPAVAIVFDVSLQRCLAQNGARAGRRVPEDVVRRHHAQMRLTLGTLPREGYHAIVLLRDADIAAA